MKIIKALVYTVISLAAIVIFRAAVASFSSPLEYGITGSMNLLQFAVNIIAAPIVGTVWLIFGDIGISWPTPWSAINLCCALTLLGYIICFCAAFNYGIRGGGIFYSVSVAAFLSYGFSIREAFFIPLTLFIFAVVLVFVIIGMVCSAAIGAVFGD